MTCGSTSVIRDLRIFRVGRGPPGSSPALRWMVLRGIKRMNSQWIHSHGTERILQICLTTLFFSFLGFGLSHGVGFGVFFCLLVFIFANYCTLKAKPTKPLPPVSFGKEPCAGKLDLSKAAFCTDQSHMVMDVSYHVQIMSCIWK